MAEQGGAGTVGRTISLASGKEVRVATPQEALESAESGFGAWDMPGKILYVGHAFWLLKEVFWMFLLSYFAFVFGFLAMVLVGIAVLLRRNGGISGKLYHESVAEVLVNITQLSWVTVNFISIIMHFGYELRDDEETPKYARDWVNLCTGSPQTCGDTSDALLLVVRIGFCLTIGIWILSCCYLLWLWITPPRFVAQGHAFQTCILEGGWIAFWVMKDLAWTWGKDGLPVAFVAFGIHFVLLVGALVINSARSQITLWDGLTMEEMEAIGDVFCHVDLVIISYILWSLSNLSWMLTEDVFDEDFGWRYASAGLCAVALVFFLAGYPQAKQKGLVLQKLARVDPAVVGKPQET